MGRETSYIDRAITHYKQHAVHPSGKPRIRCVAFWKHSYVFMGKPNDDRKRWGCALCPSEHAEMNVIRLMKGLVVKPYKRNKVVLVNIRMSSPHGTDAPVLKDSRPCRACLALLRREVPGAKLVYYAGEAWHSCTPAQYPARTDPDAPLYSSWGWESLIEPK